MSEKLKRAADRPRTGVTVALALLAVPLVPICCLSGLGVLLSMAPSEPCRPPFADDPSQCGPEPLAVLQAAVLAGGYVVVAAVLALRTTLPTWTRILALALAPLIATPLLWAWFVH
ncbi:hypothetical protein [Asanoa sp. NPDC050611]|uniref:hypothetical protein n=1 Tax=Asanoa sp. NPDC050611 TaxID=3157098 RepID=UPI0033C76CA7